MATSSFLGGSLRSEDGSGKDLHALGPSDNSDSGSDAVGAYGDDELASDSDASGTGERAAVGTGRSHFDADILPDHIELSPANRDEGDADNPDTDGFGDSGLSGESGELGDVENLVDDDDDDDLNSDQADDTQNNLGRA